MSSDRRDEWIVVTDDAKTLPVIEVLTGRGFVTGKSGSGKSVLEGTIVYTASGRKPIEEVETGERVLSLNPYSRKQEFQEVLATLEHEAEDLLRITLADGTEVVGTEDHSFLTEVAGEIVPIRGEDLTKGIQLPCSRLLPASESVTCIDVSDDGEPILVDEDSRASDCSITLDADVGAQLGQWLATDELSFSFDPVLDSTDETVRDRVTTYIENEFTDSLPDWIFETPATFRTAFLREYVVRSTATPGHVSLRGNQRLLKQFAELFQHCGISATIEREDDTDFATLTADSPIAELAKGNHAIHRRNAESPLVASAESSASSTMPSTVESATNSDEDIRWEPIVEIEPLTVERTVYDLDVRHNDNFIANGVFVHNSNTAGVIAEELLANGYNILIVDTEGEYFGLKEQFELLHVGGDEFADIEVTPSHAKKIAEIAIEQNMPVILDVSGYFDAADAEAVIQKTLEHIYHLEKDARKPFLIMVEEMQEYLPQQGGGTELAELLERIAKRGRKRGLGICGMSQRPSSVDKDFITQCDWMVWHRLTWETDLNVVRNILGSDRADEIQQFDPGRGILMTDWDDMIETVQFKRKRTHDAGATPGLESYDRPDLQTIGTELIREIKGEGAAELHREEHEDDETFEVDIPDFETDAIVEEESDETEGTEELDEEALTADVSAVKKRNQLLTAEIEELRSILDGVEQRDPAPTVGRPPSTEPLDIEPPQPPRRPANRNGVAGNFVEFGQMMVYLVQSAWYRIRLRYLESRRDSQPIQE